MALFKLGFSDVWKTGKNRELSAYLPHLRIDCLVSADARSQAAKHAPGSGSAAGNSRDSDRDQSDDERIKATLAGDATAYESLVLKYQDRLFNTLYRITHSREEAEDVAQDAFVQAYVKLSSFQGKSQFYTWLYRIAFNISVSRRRKKRPVLSVDHTQEVSGNEPVDSRPSAQEKLEQQEDVQAIHSALARLSDDHRCILVLRELEGCDYETIGEALDLPVGTVRSRLFRARKQLKEELEQGGHDGSDA